MEKYFAILIVLLLLSGCSKKEKELELFSVEAFAYSMNNGWEINATCLIKGFEQKELENQYKVKLSFTVDLQTPTGHLFQEAGEGLIDQTAEERITDLPIETQILLDSIYTAGKYIIIFNVTDYFSGKSVSIKKEFEISN